MISRIRLFLIPLLLLLLPMPVLGGEERPKGEQLFKVYCGSCHSLELPQSQHLDRDTWQWVISDMVEEFGASFITPEEQALILDYLVEHHGPRK